MKTIDDPRTAAASVERVEAATRVTLLRGEPNRDGGRRS